MHAALHSPIDMKKSMRKQKKDRERRRHPRPDPSKQQQAEELFVFRSANSTVKFESAQDFGRYLREKQEVDRSVLQSVKQMLDKGELRVHYSRRGRPAKLRLPSSGPELADLIDPPPDSQIWIEPARYKRRLRKARHRAHQRAICLLIDERLVKEGGKLYLAVERVKKENGFSESTIRRALKANKR
jgi:hypothetical protein